jgi:hypothetical protein
MADGYLIVAPDGEGMRAEEITSRLAALARPLFSDVAFRSLDASAVQLSPDDEINVIEIMATGEDTAAGAAARAHAAAVARRLGWDLLGPSAESPATERLRELARAAQDDGRPAGFDRWLTGAFQAPAWVLVVAAVLAFSAAGGLLLVLGVQEARFGRWLGIVGAAFLLVALLLVGGWRARRRLAA